MIAISKLVNRLKGDSSRLLRKQFPGGYIRAITALGYGHQVILPPDVEEHRLQPYYSISETNKSTPYIPGVNDGVLQRIG